MTASEQAEGPRPWHPAAWPIGVTGLVLAVLLVAVAALSYDLIRNLRAEQQMRIDLAELENIQYGLLNAEIWVDELAVIMETKIREMDLGPENRAAIRSSVSRMLDTLIVEVDRYLRRRNQQGDWWERFRGSFKQGVQDMLIDVDDIREAVPQYADMILIELDKPEARQELTRFLKSLLTDITRSRMARVNMRPIIQIKERYQCQEAQFCRGVINGKKGQAHARAEWQAVAVVVLVGLMLLLVWRLPRQQPAAVFGALLLAVSCLMACGVLTPMMEVEARIAELRLALFGETIIFRDQVLYFQSKSILDVVAVMIQAKRPETLLVGVLVMSFSVLFPLAKLLAATVLLHGRTALAQNSVVQFFALRSSKWSMADVMVVSILMAFLGFEGLISNQLARLDDVGASAEVLTTNGTQLQLGFYLFFAFCMASLFSSGLLERRLPQSSGS